MAIAGANAAFARDAPAVWFSPNDPLRRPFGVKGPDDFNLLFASTRDWPLVASRVNVIQLYTYYVLYAPEDDLKRIFAFLRSHRMDLSLEIGVLPASQACGLGIEGYDGKLLMRAADRISQLGGTLRFVAMDEPLWHGAHYDGPRACHSTPEFVAGQAAAAINELHARYPDIQVGQIETFPLSNDNGWQSELLRWAAEFQRGTHRPLAFFHADVIHTPGAPAAIKSLQAAYQAQGIPFGYIDTGSSLEQSDAGWTAEATKLYTEMEAQGVNPDSIVFESWVSLPDHILPESDTSSLTGVLQGYLRSPSHLTARRSGAAVALQLADGSGRPLPHKQLRIEVFDGASPHTSQETISGVVPANATTALLAIRGNTECGCSGSGRVTIGNVTYSETATGERHSPSAEWTAPTGFAIELKPSEPVKVNSAPLRVGAGNAFTLRFDETAELSAADGGYVSLIFRNADGREVSRFKDIFRPRGTSLPPAETDESGSARVTTGASGLLQIDFAGDAADRPSRLTLR